MGRQSAPLLGPQRRGSGLGRCGEGSAVLRFLIAIMTQSIVHPNVASILLADHSCHHNINKRLLRSAQRLPLWSLNKCIPPPLGREMGSCSNPEFALLQDDVTPGD